jgi:PqqD family protein of HPr-rel-A system
MSPRDTIWHLAAHDLQWRGWDDQWIVYHAASGDTHLLSLVAGEVLQALQQTPSSVATLAEQVAASLKVSAGQEEELFEQVERLLQELESLGLVEAVPP